MNDITHEDIEIEGLRLHVASLGPEDGALVVLLHGFPEYWGAWRVHMGVLARAGFRVIAPDQRGYGTSDKPTAVRDYRLDLLADDVAGLIAAMGRTRAHVVGHDWGGAVTWRVLQKHGACVDKAVVINCPPVEVLEKTAWRHPMQAIRSWYTLAMQMPWLPEWFLSVSNFHQLSRAMESSSRPGTFAAEDLVGYRAAWAEPGALGSMLAWYRAALRHRPPAPPDHGRIDHPVCLIWGEQDRFLGTELIAPTLEKCQQGRLVGFPDATHWVLHEELEAVCDTLLEFFGVPESAVGS